MDLERRTESCLSSVKSSPVERPSRVTRSFFSFFLSRPRKLPARTLSLSLSITLVDTSSLNLRDNLERSDDEREESRRRSARRLAFSMLSLAHFGQTIEVLLQEVSVEERRVSHHTHTHTHIHTHTSPLPLCQRVLQQTT